MDQTELQTLAALLQKLAEIINDADTREQDPEGHRQQLKDVLEQIRAKSESLTPGADPRLHHFLTQHSYDKALDWIQTQYLSGS